MKDTLDAIRGRRVSDRRFISAHDASDFAHLSLDENGIHHSSKYARTTRLGRKVVSGTQTGGLMMGLAASMSNRLGEAVGIEFHFRFVAPVFVDQFIDLEWLVYRSRYSKTLDANILHLIGRVRNADGETCVSGKGKTLVYR